MARVQRLLFGAGERPTLERYALLERLGEGRHGAVYSAWDPRLDRKVAVKLLHGGRDEALEREARALAQLSHPNVVAVHDVGESADGLFLAMEFVDGVPLSSLDPAQVGWRSVVAAYRQAAAGLAAAHDAEIVHRAFEPTNALLGRDGRVRVIDFGLARGDTIDHRTDQLAFCTALWEALHGRAASPGDASSQTPARLDRVLRRGMAPAPTERFASMHALDAALGSALQRRTRFLAGLGIAATALALGVGLGRFGSPCAASRTLPPRWTSQTRAALSQAFIATGLPHAEASERSTRELLDRWANTWAAAREDACMLHERGVQSDEGLDFRTACLDGERERFDALLDVLLDADAAAVDKAIDAAAALPSPAACADLEALRTAHPIPDDIRPRLDEAWRDLVRARAEFDASHHARAVELAHPHAEACRSKALSHPPTCVEAILVEAEAQGYLGHHDDALRGLREAAVEAQRARLPAPFAQAAANLTWELGELDASFDDALTWAALGHAALERQDAPAVSLRLLNNEGAVLDTAGRWNEAIEVHQRRLAMLPADSPLRMHSLANLANIDNRRGRVAEAEVAYAKALELGEAAYGRSHPRVLTTRQNRAGMRVRTGRTPEAVAELEIVVALQRRVLGNDHPDLAAPLTNLSIAQLSLGDAQAALASAVEARRLVTAAYGDRSPRTIDILLAEVDALRGLGRTTDAVQISEQAVRLAESLFGPDHSTLAYTLRGLGLALQADGRETEASSALQQARTLFAAHGMARDIADVDAILAETP